MEKVWKIVILVVLVVVLIVVGLGAYIFLVKKDKIRPDCKSEKESTVAEKDKEEKGEEDAATEEAYETGGAAGFQPEINLDPGELELVDNKEHKGYGLQAKSPKTIYESEKMTYFAEWLDDENFVFGEQNDLYVGMGEGIAFFHTKLDSSKNKEIIGASIINWSYENVVEKINDNLFYIAGHDLGDLDVEVDDKYIYRHFNVDGDKIKDVSGVNERWGAVSPAKSKYKIEVADSKDQSKVGEVTLKNTETGELRLLGKATRSTGTSSDEIKGEVYEFIDWTPDGKSAILYKMSEFDVNKRTVYKSIYDIEYEVVVLSLDAKSLSEEVGLGWTHLPDGTSATIGIRWSDDGRYFMDINSGNVFDLTAKKALRQTEPDRKVGFVKMSGSGGDIAIVTENSCNEDYSVCDIGLVVEELKSGKYVAHEAIKIKNRFNNLEWSPDGKNIVYTDGDDILMYNLANKKSYQLILKGNSIQNVKWSPDGSKIGYGSGNKVFVTELETVN